MEFSTYETTVVEDVSAGEHVKKQGREDPVTKLGKRSEQEEKPEREGSWEPQGTRTFESGFTSVVWCCPEVKMNAPNHGSVLDT